MLTLFSFAPAEIDDAILLGSLIPPEALTVADLAAIDPNHITAPLANLTDANIVRLTIELEEVIMLAGALDQDQIYARALNEMLLKPFGLGDTGRFYILAGAISRILHLTVEKRPSRNRMRQ